MELDVLWRIMDEGSTPIVVIIAYLIWRLDKTMNTFLTDINAKQKSRDDKLDSIHSDIGAMIRKLAGMKNGRNTNES